MSEDMYTSAPPAPLEQEPENMNEPAPETKLYYKGAEIVWQRPCVCGNYHCVGDC